MKLKNFEIDVHLYIRKNLMRFDQFTITVPTIHNWFVCERFMSASKTPKAYLQINNDFQHDMNSIERICKRTNLKWRRKLKKNEFPLEAKSTFGGEQIDRRLIVFENKNDSWFQCLNSLWWKREYYISNGRTRDRCDDEPKYQNKEKRNKLIGDE